MTEPWKYVGQELADMSVDQLRFAAASVAEQRDSQENRVRSLLVRMLDKPGVAEVVDSVGSEVSDIALLRMQGFDDEVVDFAIRAGMMAVHSINVSRKCDAVIEMVRDELNRRA